MPCAPCPALPTLRSLSPHPRAGIIPPLSSPAPLLQAAPRLPAPDVSLIVANIVYSLNARPLEQQATTTLDALLDRLDQYEEEEEEAEQPEPQQQGARGPGMGGSHGGALPGCSLAGLGCPGCLAGQGSPRKSLVDPGSLPMSLVDPGSMQWEVEELPDSDADSLNQEAQPIGGGA